MTVAATHVITFSQMCHIDALVRISLHLTLRACATKPYHPPTQTASRQRSAREQMVHIVFNSSKPIGLVHPLTRACQLVLPHRPPRRTGQQGHADERRELAKRQEGGTKAHTAQRRPGAANLNSGHLSAPSMTLLGLSAQRWRVGRHAEVAATPRWPPRQGGVITGHYRCPDPPRELHTDAGAQARRDPNRFVYRLPIDPSFGHPWRWSAVVVTLTGQRQPAPGVVSRGGGRCDVP